MINVYIFSTYYHRSNNLCTSKVFTEKRKCDRAMYILFQVLIRNLAHIYKKTHQPQMDDYQPTICLYHAHLFRWNRLCWTYSDIRVSFPWIICCKNCLLRYGKSIWVHCVGLSKWRTTNRSLSVECRVDDFAGWNHRWLNGRLRKSSPQAPLVKLASLRDMNIWVIMHDRMLVQYILLTGEPVYRRAGTLKMR